MRTFGLVHWIKGGHTSGEGPYIFKREWWLHDNTCNMDKSLLMWNILQSLFAHWSYRFCLCWSNFTHMNLPPVMVWHDLKALLLMFSCLNIPFQTICLLVCLCICPCDGYQGLVFPTGYGEGHTPLSPSCTHTHARTQRPEALTIETGSWATVWRQGEEAVEAFSLSCQCMCRVVGVSCGSQWKTHTVQAPDYLFKPLYNTATHPVSHTSGPLNVWETG